MYQRVEVNSNFKIDFIVVAIIIMLLRSLADSDGLFWWPAEFENVENPDFENIKHLQNPGHLSLTKPSMCDIFLFLVFFGIPQVFSFIY